MPNYYDQLQGGNVVVNDAQRFLLDQSRPELKTADVLGAAYDDVFVWNAAGRMYDRRSSQFKADSSWNLTQQDESDLLAEYRQEDVDYLKEAKSQEEFLARKRYIQEDIEREQVIARAGGAGVATSLGLALLDPVGIALGVSSGGLGFVQKGTKAARVLKSAGVVGVESLALEAALYGGNTQAETSDLIFALGAGSVIGGTLGAFSKAKPRASAADDAIVADTDAYAVKEIVENAESVNLSRPTPSVVIQRGIVEETPDIKRMEYNAYLYDLELQEAVGSRMTRQELKAVQKERDNLISQAEEYNAGLTQFSDDIQSLRERITQTETDQASALSKAREDIEAEYGPRIESLQAKVDKLAEEVATSAKPKKANARLFKAQEELDEAIDLRSRALSSADAQAKYFVTNARKAFDEQVEAKKTANARAAASIQSRIDELESRILKASQAKDAAKQLRRFRAMSNDEQITFVHSKEGLGREIPLKEQAYKENVESLDSIPVREESPTQIAEEPEGIEPPELGTVSPAERSDSAGAARVGFLDSKVAETYSISERMKDMLTKFLQDGASVPEDLVGWRLPFKGLSRWVQGLHTYLSNSPSYVIRGLNYHLFEAPQGGTAAKVTAAARVQVNQRKIRAAMKYRLNEGYEDYAKANGKSFIQGELDTDLLQEFWKKVMIETRYPGTYGDAGVKHAAEGVRDQFRVAGKIRKDSGEAGFENLDLDKNYITRVVNGNAVFHAVQQHGKGKVKEVLSESYQRGKFKLGKETADNVADAYISRALSNKTSLAESYRQTTGKDVDQLKSQLEAAGVDQDIIDDFLQSTEALEAKKFMSDRAKFSLDPDIRVQVNGLSAIDLFETNLPKLLEAYTIDAAGGAAMAKLGFKTRAQFDEFLLATHQHAINQGMSLEEAATQVQMIKDGVDMLYGRSINKYAHERWSRNLSRLRDITALLRLQSVGLAAIPESARALTNRGVTNFMREVPAAATLIRGSRAQREGGKFSGALKDPELRELDEVLQYAGEDHIITSSYLRSEEIEEFGFQKGFGAKLDMYLAQGKRIQELTSFFRMFQGGGEKISARSLNRNIRRWMYEGEDLRLRDQEIRDAGWSDGFLEDMRAWVRDNPASDVYDGKEIKVFNFDSMPPDMRERYSIGIHRLVNRDMQRAMIGETPTFMHKLFGQTITQFRAFSITSLDKQLIHDIRHDRGAGALIFMWSAGLGLMTHSIAGALNKDEHAFDQQNMLFGTWNRMGQVASLGIATDALATLGLVPDDMMAAPNRYGFRSFGFNSVPSLGLVEDSVRTARKTSDFLLSDDSDYSAGDVVNQWQKVIPFARTIGINQAFNAIEEDLE